MIRIIMHGCNGRMGQMISDICKEEEEVKIVAGIDVAEVQNLSYPVFTGKGSGCCFGLLCRKAASIGILHDGTKRGTVEKNGFGE